MSSAVEAAQNWANAFAQYFFGAQAGGVPVVAASVTNIAEPAMASAIVFVPGPGSLAGATAIQAGLIAFWGTILAAPATFFPTTIAATRPSYSLLPAQLAAVFDSNTASELSLVDAAAAIAPVIHSSTAGLGSVFFPGSIPAAIV